MCRDAETSPRAPAPSPESGDAPARPSVERQHSDPPSMPRPARPPSPGPLSAHRAGTNVGCTPGPPRGCPARRLVLRRPRTAVRRAAGSHPGGGRRADGPVAADAGPAVAVGLAPPRRWPARAAPGARRSRDAGDPASQVQIEIGQIEVVVRRPESAD